jgi:microcystin-dependent protein
MSIIGTFPTTIQNGTTEDATQVMTLFAYIQSQTNGNACPATTGTAILKGNGSGGTAAAAAGTDYMPAVPGIMYDYAGTSVPSGFLACDGSAVSRATYATLFAAIGTTWGAGDGSTTFNVPDSRRRVTIGAGGAAIAGPANTVGAVGGEETHVLTVAELAAHAHTTTITDTGHAHGNTLNDGGHHHDWGHNNQNGAGAGAGNYGGTSGGYADPTSTNTTGITINNAVAATGIGVAVNSNGSSTAHNTMQPSMVVTKIIKT